MAVGEMVNEEEKEQVHEISDLLRDRAVNVAAVRMASQESVKDFGAAAFVTVPALPRIHRPHPTRGQAQMRRGPS